MSKFYTVDRSNNIDQNMVFSLQKNYSDHKIWTVQDIYDEEDAIARIEQLYPEGLSFHGIQYLIKECLVIFKNMTREPLPLAPTTPMIEAVFELVRRNEFPQLPSRLQSMFAWCNLDDAREFNSSLGDKHSIFEVEIKNTFIADQKLLYLGGSVIGTYEMARKYWSGDKSNNCKLEAVIPLPAVIGNKV